MSTDVVGSRRREQAQTEGRPGSLLRPGFSSPWLEAISVARLASCRSRWQLVPTHLRLEAGSLETSMGGKEVLTTKIGQGERIPVAVVYFLGVFSFCNREKNILLSLCDLAFMSTLTSFPPLLTMAPKRAGLLSISNTEPACSDFKATTLSPWSHSLLVP